LRRTIVLVVTNGAAATMAVATHPLAAAIIVPVLARHITD
jgi:hypothetical protein